MSDLSEFLLARIAEDEAVARAAEHADGPESLDWRRGGRRNLHYDNGRSESYESVFAGNWDRILVARDDGSVAAHIARHDPARVLAECAAKRRIVGGSIELITPGSEWGLGYCKGASEQHDEVLRLLALPYADHDGYDQSWSVQ